MKIVLEHPIEHDHIHYGRGIHDVPEDLGKLFLTYRHAARLPTKEELALAESPAAQRGVTYDATPATVRQEREAKEKERQSFADAVAVAAAKEGKKK